MFKIFIKDLKHYLAQRIMLTRVRSKFPSSTINNGVIIDPNTSLAENVVLFENVSLNKCSIGKHSYIQKLSNLNNVDMGSFCSVANNVTIGLAEHPLHLISTHPAFYDNSQPLRKFFVEAPIIKVEIPKTIIGHDVWIGCGVIIKAGINIGTGAVIAAGSVVTKDVPPYSVSGGVPAKTIKNRFEETLIKNLLDSKWWMLPEDNLKKHAQYFNHPEAFLREVVKPK